MRTKTAKELRGFVNRGLNLTLKDIETMKPEAYNLMLEATEELVTRNIKATDKEEYQMFLDTLKEYAPAGAPAPEAPKKPAPAPEAPKKVANTKAPKKPAPAPEAKEKKPADKIQVGNIVQFQVEGEEIQHDIKIVNIGKYNIIGVMAEDEKEVFNIRKSDFNKQVFAWTDRHNETYNIIVTL